MNKTIIITWISLLVLTICTQLVILVHGVDPKISIIILMGIKFLAVAFVYMELKKAHLLWQLLIIVYLIIFISLLWLL